MGSKRRSLTPDHCEISGCDWPHQIQRHRINPGSNGGKYKLGNVIALCPNHHWLADHEFIPADDLYAIVANRPPVSTDEVADGSGGTTPAV